MKKEEFIKLARKAGFVHGNPHSEIIVRHSSGALVSIEERLHQFAILVAAAEREACAKVAEDPMHGLPVWRARKNIATAIRARGKK